MREHGYEHRERGRTEVGPKRRQVEDYPVTARNTFFADDGSGREGAKTIEILREFQKNW